ncbi:hypothetical protein P43SY_011340 [Pythium insidiosum]|uniref:G-patch domain-containing protein n=1 Tax=Pythium insidiosum TaxID=114742 RepID=A0AAD5L9W9_PYTIN|nr:hypothetical protein P43SY_011340 [Pythium insidiosum]
MASSDEDERVGGASPMVSDSDSGNERVKSTKKRKLSKSTSKKSKKKSKKSKSIDDSDDEGDEKRPKSSFIEDEASESEDGDGDSDDDDDEDDDGDGNEYEADGFVVDDEDDDEESDDDGGRHRRRRKKKEKKLRRLKQKIDAIDDEDLLLVRENLGMDTGPARSDSEDEDMDRGSKKKKDDGSGLMSRELSYRMFGDSDDEEEDAAPARNNAYIGTDEFVRECYDHLFAQPDEKCFQDLTDFFALDASDANQDGVSIHPESYYMAVRMCGDANNNSTIDMYDPNQYSYAVEDTMFQSATAIRNRNAPRTHRLGDNEIQDALSELDLQAYANRLEIQKKGPKLLTLECIKRELRYPYFDKREPYKGPSDEDLFIMLSVIIVTAAMATRKDQAVIAIAKIRVADTTSESQGSSLVAKDIRDSTTMGDLTTAGATVDTSFTMSGGLSNADFSRMFLKATRADDESSVTTVGTGVAEPDNGDSGSVADAAMRQNERLYNAYGGATADEEDRPRFGGLGLGLGAAPSSRDDASFRGDKNEEPSVKKKVLSEAELRRRFTWEKHTKGFGLKMMAKMGFTGRLGKDEKGVSTTIEVVQRPAQMGLGFGSFKEASALKQNKRVERELRDLMVKVRELEPLVDKSMEDLSVGGLLNNLRDLRDSYQREFMAYNLHQLVPSLTIPTLKALVSSSEMLRPDKINFVADQFRQVQLFLLELPQHADEPQSNGVGVFYHIREKTAYMGDEIYNYILEESLWPMVVHLVNVQWDVKNNPSACAKCPGSFT